MLTNEEVIERLRAAPNLLAISKGADIPYASLWRVAKAQQEPKVSLVNALRDYFQREDRPQ